MTGPGEEEEASSFLVTKISPVTTTIAARTPTATNRPVELMAPVFQLVPTVPDPSGDETRNMVTRR
jgi:hypothetical protein